MDMLLDAIGIHWNNHEFLPQMEYEDTSKLEDNSGFVHRYKCLACNQIVNVTEIDQNNINFRNHDGECK